MQGVTALVTALLAFVAGCSDRTGGRFDAAEGLPRKDGGAAAYPAGPYGTRAGSVMEDATFLGYRDFRFTVLAPVALHDFYAADGSKTTADGAPLHTLAISVAAVWCNACVEEAKVLDDVAYRFGPAGVQFVQDLYEGTDPRSGAPATQQHLDQWMANFALPFPVFLDPKKKMAPYIDVTLLPFTLIVDARTMTILRTEQGFSGRAGIESYLCAYAAQKPSVCP